MRRLLMIAALGLLAGCGVFANIGATVLGYGNIVPDAPTDLVYQRSEGVQQITWSDNSVLASGYRVYAVDDSGKRTLVGETAPNIGILKLGDRCMPGNQIRVAAWRKEAENASVLDVTRNLRLVLDTKIDWQAAEFSFSSGRCLDHYECALSSDTFVACTSPYQISEVTDGKQTLRVRAVAADGATVQEASYDWVVAGYTVISSGPDAYSGSAVSFVFAAAEASGFVCRMDGGSFADCVSPAKYSNLKDGSHKFEVAALDSEGNQQDPAALWSWIVDATDPETTILSGPPPVTDATAVSISFEGSDAGSGVDHFECHLDAATWATCTSPMSYTGLSQASHTFEVRAVDVAGNADGSPASSNWQMNGPNTMIDSGPPPVADSTSATFVFSGYGDVDYFECRLDGAAWATCVSQKLYTGLSQSSHAFEVRAVDTAGNADGSPASLNWTIGGIVDNFDGPTVPSGWILTGNTNWTIDTTTTYAGGGALVSGVITNSQNSTVAYTIDSTGGDACFYYKVSSESGYDFLHFYVDGTQEQSWSGSVPWTQYCATLGSGTHTLKWSYTKDGSTSSGSDRAWIDSLTIVGGSVASDITPPQTTIDSGPSGTVSSSGATFSFSCNEGSCTYECQLDSGGWSGCTSPKSYTGLADASYTFEVHAIDAANNTDATPASRSWTVNTTVPDTTPPDTTINSGPSGTVSSNSASFTFGCNESSCTYECQFDGAGWSGCSSPKNYTGLADASYTFEVHAIDAANNTDATPASRSWTVNTTVPDTTPPQTTIDGGPSGTVSSSGATFAFSCNESSCTYQCQLDGAGWSGCSSPKSYTGLADASYTFAVRAIDAASNTDATPASRSWTIDTTPPQTTINSGPSGTVSSNSASFTFGCNESSCTYQCQLDGGGFAACTSPKTYSALADGSHTFNAKAIDSSGNVDTSPSSQSWIVDTIVCGNGTCDLTEDCNSCSADCPTCQIRWDVTNLGLVSMGTVRFRVFNQTTSVIWPSSSTVWNLPYNSQQSLPVQCSPGELVCYGADTIITSPHWNWGRGISGSNNCSACCYTCTEGVVTKELRTSDPDFWGD